MKEFQKPAPTQALVMETLKDFQRPMTIRSVAVWSGLPYRYAAKLLRDMHQMGRCKRVSLGIYTSVER